ncbi:MAG: ROK family protein [Burkholderiales bacterium]|nr:ROK family protein [Burkholderiales bacterium]
MKRAQRVLVVDIGGTNVKILATGQTAPRRFPSGPRMRPKQMVAGVRKLAADWDYDLVSIGYPGVVAKGRIVAEPHNLGPGWRRFDFEKAFARPVRIINDAAMQALGSYRGGTMLFLGLGTGLGSALIVNGTVVPMELAHLPWGESTYEGYLGVRGLEKFGKSAWRKNVANVVKRFVSALLLDDVVLGGGNAKKLTKLPPGCRLGDNSLAFLGGYRLWEPAPGGRPPGAPAIPGVAARKAGKTRRNTRR